MPKAKTKSSKPARTSTPKRSNKSRTDLIVTLRLVSYKYTLEELSDLLDVTPQGGSCSIGETGLEGLSPRLRKRFQRTTPDYSVLNLNSRKRLAGDLWKQIEEMYAKLMRTEGLSLKSVKKHGIVMRLSVGILTSSIMYTIPYPILIQKSTSHPFMDLDELELVTYLSSFD